MVVAFEELVAEALDSLPSKIAAAMENVEVVIEDVPPPELLRELPPGSSLLGHYWGVPLTNRGSSYQRVLPDKISIYRRPIEHLARTAEEVRRQVRRTVIHEVAHHFGIDDARLEELGWD